MPEDPKYVLEENDIIKAAFWNEGNIQTIIDALNSGILPEELINASRLNVVDIPIPVLDGGELSDLI